MNPSNIKAYFMRASYKGYWGEISNTLDAFKKYVGGVIQVISINGVVDLICNEEGKVMGLPVNRALLDADGKPVDIFAGDIVAVRHDEEGNFTDIHESDIETIRKYLIPLDYAKVHVLEEDRVMPVLNENGKPKVLNVLVSSREEDLKEWGDKG